MTEQELAEIELRVNAATVGPWLHDTDGGAIGAVEAGDMALAQVQQRVPRDNERRDLDARFIAHARSDVPALIAEVRNLRDKIVIAKMRAEALLVVNGDLARDNETLEAECEALLSVIERVRPSIHLAAALAVQPATGGADE